MDKNEAGKLKSWVDMTIEFLKLLSKYLGGALAAIFLPHHKK